jgi:hypothetical protein
MMHGIVQQRLLQLRQGPGDHHGHQEVRDEQGDRLHHHHQDGRQCVQDILREEPEMSSKPKEKILNMRKERGPQLAYLVNRQDGSSLPTPAPQKTWSLLSKPGPKKEKDEVQEDEAEMTRKTIQEGEKKNQEENIKYSYSESKNCTERTSGDHAYLGSGGVESGLRQQLDVPHLRHHHHLRELSWMFLRSFHHL